MNKWIIYTVIVIIIHFNYYFRTYYICYKNIENSKKEKVKIIKIEEKNNRSANHDDPEIMRHWYNPEIELIR